MAQFPEGNYTEKAKQQIAKFQAADAWGRIQHLPDDSLTEINAKSFRILDFCQQFSDSEHYAEAVSLGKQLDAKKEFTSNYHSIFGLMEVSNKPGPYQEAARERLVVLRKEQQENTPVAPVKRVTKTVTPSPKKKEQSAAADNKQKKVSWSNSNDKNIIKNWLKLLTTILPLVALVLWAWNRYEVTQEQKEIRAEQLARIDEALQREMTEVDTNEVIGFKSAYRSEFPEVAQEKIDFIDQWMASVRDSLKREALMSESAVEENVVASNTKTEERQPPPPLKDDISPEPVRVVSEIEKNMVRVAGGEFIMGCQDGRDTDCSDDEKPAHKVSLSTFYISKYEVTQAQWRAVMGNDPPKLYNKGCDQCPVEMVSWNDIQDFLQKLNNQTGQKYRLPTEAEWEYAARGGANSQGFLYSGSNNIDEVAWYESNAKADNTHGTQKTTRPVGRKKANELGLFDMSGNIWEWCSDGYDGDYYKNSPRNNPTGATTGSDRVRRGGSWISAPQYCRAANRLSLNPAGRNGRIGFRLARTQFLR
ncbi:MAG: formylglycine-generating enzyme family protein [Bacteroidota bacterium]